MEQASLGDTVCVHYTGKLSDGTVFDSSSDGDPLEFEIGSGRLIPGFENAIVGMKPGESKSARLSPEDAYGERNDELLWEVDKAQIPEDVDLDIGLALQSVTKEGEKFTVFVSEISESTVTLDANHPLAGKELTFDIELVEIK